MDILTHFPIERNISYQSVSYTVIAIRSHSTRGGDPFTAILFREEGAEPIKPTLCDEDTDDRQVIRVALDGEWQQREGTRIRDPLSLQMAARALDGRLYAWVLLFPERKGDDLIPRPSLSATLAWFLDDTASLTGYEWHDARAPKGSKKEWLQLVLVAHYGIVDLTLFFDRKKLVRSLDTVRRTLVSIEKPVFCTVWSDDRNKNNNIAVHVRDTMLLAPAGSSLAKLGEAMRLPKISLPDGYEKSEMGRLLNEQPVVYMVYAIRDSELTLKWSEAMSNEKVPPATLGGISSKQVREAICEINGWNRKEFDYEFRGLSWQTEVDYSEGEPKRRRITVPRPEASLLLTAAQHAYYGGRNEGFCLGIHHAPDGWYDYDLCGAYPAAMVLVPDPDYGAPATAIQGRIVKGLLRYDSLFFGYVRFKFPDGTRFPCLPVKDVEGRGLIFPLEGDEWAAAPEIVLALHFGATVELLQPGLILAGHERHSLGLGVRGLVEARARAAAEYGKRSPQEMAAKEIANSAYGKTAQGIAGKRAYSTRYDQSRLIPVSAITSSIHATMTTALVRAIVSAAMHQLDQMGYHVASVTTDGFLTDAPPDVIESLDLYGLQQAFADARRFLVGDPKIWEVKHRARSLVMLRTRGGFGVGSMDKYELPAAAAGYKATGPVKERISQLGRSEALAELFLRRDGDLTVTFHALPSPSEYVRRDADAVGKDVTRKISWEWDHKREIDASTARDEQIVLDGTTYTHVSAWTKPWRTVSAFARARQIVEDHPLTLKSASDVVLLNHTFKRVMALLGTGLRAKGGAKRSVAISVLRAIRACELTADWLVGQTGAEIIRRVSDASGIALNANDWKNAGRKTRRVHVLVGAEELIAKLGLIKTNK
jgi:hypothetical protein